MTDISQAARHLAEICTQHGTHVSGRGANEAEIEEAKKTFADLGFPLPSDLLDVYRQTLGIPGIWTPHSILACAFQYDEPGINADLEYLEMADYESEEEGVLWLGQTGRSDLLIDRDGQCSTRFEFRDDGSVELIDPTDFKTAFLEYVAKVDDELRQDSEED